ncbi:PREDICTED: glutamate receptor 1.2-like [Prunus mume]|uniref:Glutamate receptor 1.2-like n=1 Tax=Prunus mume TaxID=102107 RepID=A0ABM1LQN7_PRUMU|nr:PREDICTED: glutamate receptor 1.2-like [Prunus mume]
MDPSVIEATQGVLGLKSYTPASTRLHNLTSRLRKIFYMQDPNIEVSAVTPDGIWAYDATWALAEAVERTWTSTGLNLVNLNNITSSKHGLLLLQEILQTRFKGISNEEIQYPNGKLVSSAFEIVNVIGKGERRTFDAVVGDTTITSERSQYVGFTIPYTDLGVGMLVSNENGDMWIFLKPLSADLWITIAGFFILTGFVVWVIERPANPEYQGKPSQQIGTILWFSFSTLVFAHREKLLNNLAKFVVIIWVFAVLILTSSYTATLTSIMAVNQIRLNSRGDYIGYQSGSFTQGLVKNLNFKGLKPYNLVEEYALALSRGSNHGGVSAIVDEVPYMKIFLAHYPTGYSMIKPESSTNGFGFVFPKGSKLVHDMSMRIQLMREEGKLIEMEKVWFHKRTIPMFDNTTSDPNTLNFHTFRGLFLVTGVSSAFALFIFIIFPLKEKWYAVKKFRFRYQV